jgi:tetratricopeptide (TPR) repeat protein
MYTKWSCTWKSFGVACRVMRRTALLLSFLTVCKPSDDAASKDSAAKPDEAGKTAEQTKPAGEAETKPETKPSEKPKQPKLEADKARELRKTYRKLLDEGRTLTKADKLDEAMAKYNAALEIDPSNPTVLAELGWAQFKAHALDDAQATTMGALRLAQDDNARGMMLYNLGRIAEARGEKDAAITYYRTSLEKRPGNATVQGHLDALLAGKQIAAAPAGLGHLAEDVVDLAAACTVIIAERCVDYGGTQDPAESEGWGVCTCDSTTLGNTPAGDDSWGVLAMKVDEWRQEVYFPVVKTNGGFVVFDAIEWSFNPGAAGIFEEVHFEPTTTAPLLPGAAKPQLVLAWKKDRSDSDMGVNEFEAEHHEAMVVCAREDAKAWCTEPLVHEDSYIRDVEFPREEEEEPIDHTGLPISNKYAATYELRDGKLIVSGVVREGDPGEQRAAGEYLLTELLGKK